MAKTEEFWATGRRKTAVARVKMVPGEGNTLINGHTIEEYFPRPIWQLAVGKPQMITETGDRFDISVNVKGGGLTGQADAVLLGIARALEKYDPELRGVLKSNGLLRRDPRVKERKKYGQRGARAKFQFSKR